MSEILTDEKEKERGAGADSSRKAPRGARLLGRNRAAGLFALIAAAAAAGAAVLQPFIQNEQHFAEYLSYYDGLSESQAGLARALYCRDSVYGDLCKLGTVYLGNCHDGVFTGGREIYESLYASLSVFDDTYTEQAENIFGLKNVSSRALKIEQLKFTINTIDSDYYDFYVSYGDEYLTNIKDLNGSLSPEQAIEALKEKYPDWYYLRDGTTISAKTKYDEGGMKKTEVYYTALSETGERTLTSEYIDSDKLIAGNCLKDNYGRYILCFGESGDTIIPNNDGDNIDLGRYQLDSEGDLHILNLMNDEDGDAGYVEITVSSEQPEYRQILSGLGGVYGADGNWHDLAEMSDYQLTQVDLSELKVFMSPKTDIAAASETFIKRHSAARRNFAVIQAVLTGMLCLCGAVSLLCMLIRSKERYSADGEPAVYTLLKTDTSLLLIGVSAWWGRMTIVNVLYTYDAGGVPKAEVLAARGAAAALPVMGLALGLGGLIRQFKLHGVHENHGLLIRDIVKVTAGLRRRAMIRFYSTQLMKGIAALGVLTRHRLRFAAAVASAGILFLTVSAEGSYSEIFRLFVIGALVLFAICGLGYIIGADRIAKDSGRLTKQAEEMLGSDSSGETEIRSVKNELDISSPVYALGERLESVSGAAEKAVEDRLRSERLKIELVTNVSHDLKTPLTSIISYIDLLSRCELSDEARDYVTIISRKADKLRDIVADVFTLAKAVSGAEVELSELDFAVLARQVYADIQDKADSSGRELRTDIPQISAPVTADGGKLYRVIQNLLDNALKYSMEGSRVYMTFREKDRGFELEVRNVCEKEPDFTAEEVMERFVRGDKSRTDGGSGLGLSIAKSFTEACGGSFSIEIDRDIFSARVYFDRREVPGPETEDTSGQQGAPAEDKI